MDLSPRKVLHLPWISYSTSYRRVERRFFPLPGRDVVTAESEEDRPRRRRYHGFIDRPTMLFR